MPRRHANATTTTTTTTTTTAGNPSFLSRLRARRAHTNKHEAAHRNRTAAAHNNHTGTHHAGTHHNNHTAHRNEGVMRRDDPVHHHQQRRTGMGDKISGGLMKLRGSVERKPGLKAAGTRRQHGTDGRGSRRKEYVY